MTERADGWRMRRGIERAIAAIERVTEHCTKTKGVPGGFLVPARMIGYLDSALLDLKRTIEPARAEEMKDGK